MYLCNWVIVPDVPRGEDSITDFFVDEAQFRVWMDH